MLIHLICAARPNFMKIAPLYHALKNEAWADPFIVHTGQHYDLNMSDAFFKDLSLPEPDLHLGVGSGSHAEHLHALGPVVTIAEIGLLCLALVHVTTGIILFFGNLRARPTRYAVNKRAGGRTWGSATMPYTGLLLLCFVVLHLLNFHFVDKSQTTIYVIVAAKFSQIWYVCIYVAAMIVVALHVRLSIAVASGGPVERRRWSRSGSAGEPSHRRRSPTDPPLVSVSRMPACCGFRWKSY